MLPLEWYDVLEPAPDHVFVDRDDVAEAYRGLIIVPASYRAARRSSMATVVRCGSSVTGLEGKRVVLSAGVGRCLKFGSRGEKVLYACRPVEMIGWVYKNVDADNEGQREVSGRFLIRAQQDDDGKVEDAAVRHRG